MKSFETTNDIGTEMASRWGNALVAACMGMATLHPAQAQVDWTTTLNLTPVPIALSQRSVASASDGAIYTASVANDGESSRVRLSRTTAAGVTQWSRWADGSYSGSQLPLLIHPDNSASVVYQTGINTSCIHNFSAAGDSRWRQCFGSTPDVRVTLAADGDVYVAFGNNRVVKKFSPIGVERWSRAESRFLNGPLSGNGIDSAGNYFEVQNSYLRSWSSVDGTLTSSAVLTGFNWVASSPSGKDAVALAGRDVSLIHGMAFLSNAVVAAVGRYGASGALLWSTQVIFPGANSNEYISLSAADGDAIYVIRSSYGEGDSQIAKVSATGAILWQRHYSRIRRVIESTGGLLAIRSDTSTTPAASDSYVFPIAASDGALGTATKYSRTDAFAPTGWFAVTGGVAAIFQANNPFTPFASYPTSLLATTAFVEIASAGRWVNVADAPPPASVSQGDCLMPRLALSSPASWWARTQTLPQAAAVSDWSTVAGSSGTVQARTALSAVGCGAPITTDGGRVIVSGGSDRVKKIDASGSTVWQASSAQVPSTASVQPLQAVAANGDITYASGSLVGRVSATGSILFETNINQGGPQYLALDSGNGIWVVSGGSLSFVITRLSQTGVVLWANSFSSASCLDATLAARILPSDEMVVATQSCPGALVYKINTAGQIAWQRVFGGTTLRPRVLLLALQNDLSGNIFAGGCMSDGSQTSLGSNAVSLLLSLTAAGADRWTAQSDLIASAAECVTSVAVDSGNNVYAASSSSDNTREPILWSFTSTGVERWRHGRVLSAPSASSTEIAIDAAGELVALGEAAPGINGPRQVSVRRINVAAIGSSLKLKFLEVPIALIGYREQFPVRIGLRTTTDVAINATGNVVVSLGMQNGNGALDGTRSCTITVGASECIVSDLRYNVIETGVTLSAGADGFATVTSPTMGFTKATSVTTISALSQAPYNAYSLIRIRIAVLAPPVPSPASGGSAGYINGPFSPVNIGLACANNSEATSLLSKECDLLLRSTSMPLTAQFVASSSNYLGSSASPTSFPITKVIPTLQVSADPDNTNVLGDRLRFRVSLIEPGGFNVSPFVGLATVTLSNGGTCLSTIIVGGLYNKYSGSYLLCEITLPPAGFSTVDFGFSGNADLLAAASVSRSVTIGSGGVLRGIGTTFPSTVSVCSTAPGVTCGFVGGNSQWQCVGPAGMSGQIFFLSSSGSYYFTGSPVQFSNLSGVENYTANIPYSTPSNACALDIDGDGARLSMTDGILILRRMLLLSGSALTTGATHACTPRTAVAIAQSIALSAYDIDGDGETRAETDGLLLLRAMLGFRGDALITGVIGTNATRRTAQDIQAFLTNACGMLIN